MKTNLKDLEVTWQKQKKKVNDVEKQPQLFNLNNQRQVKKQRLYTEEFL